MQSSRHLSVIDSLSSIGIDESVAQELVSEYMKEYLREPETLGDILEVLE